MKKRIRKTGEIVDVISYVSPYAGRDDMDYVSYIDSNGVEHHKIMGLNIDWDFEDVEGELTKEIDWEEKRCEIAKAAMQGLLSGFAKARGNTLVFCHDIAKTAIMLADALIDELKKGNKG